VAVFRRGANKDLAVTVAEIEPDKQVVKRAAPNLPAVTNNLGLNVADLPESKKKDMGGKGVVIEVAESPSASADIRKGDIVLAINNIEITGARQFNEIVAKLPLGKNVAVLVSREGTASYKTVKPAVK
jgi:serine protease Do